MFSARMIRNEIKKSEQQKNKPTWWANTKTMVERLINGCKWGAPNSCSDLGEFYLDLKICKKCEDYTEKACSKNIAHACFILSGCLHYQGKEKEALRIVKQNCENNS